MQCGVQCLLRLPCLVRLLWQRQCGPSRPCQVRTLQAFIYSAFLIFFKKYFFCNNKILNQNDFHGIVWLLTGTSKTQAMRSVSMLRNLWSIRSVIHNLVRILLVVLWSFWDEYHLKEKLFVHMLISFLKLLHWSLILLLVGAYTCVYGFCLEHQNQRGGKVKLQSIVMPVMEFEHSEKGDALYGKQTFGKEHELFMDSTAVFQSTTATSIC